MGGKDVVCVKQQQDSLLQETDVQNLLKKLADERFSETTNGDLILGEGKSSENPRVTMRTRILCKSKKIIKTTIL